MGRVRRAFTAKEKLAAVSYADAHGNRAAGREFTIDESCIRQWRRQRSRLEKMPSTKKADRGTSEKFPQVEQQVYDWVSERHLQGIAVSTVEIRLQGRLIAKKLGLQDFKGSADWCYGFMRRKELSIRRRTHISQKLPEDYEDKLVQFQRFIIKQRQTYDFELSQIGNADQTPLTFDLPSASTVALKGSKTVTINTTGNEKNRFTVMLACTADGGKLPPFIIFKRKTLPKGVTWPSGVVVRCQDKGWMNDALTVDWIKTVWGKRPGALLKKKSLLVLDAFRCHKSQNVKEMLKKDLGTTLAIIPGGMTSVLQPLDVSINKPMKVMLQRRWNDWYSSGDHTFTPSGNMRKPTLLDVCTWVNDSWEELDPQIIVRAFKKCSISNALDGTEDDELWEETRQSPETCNEDVEDPFFEEPYYADCRTQRFMTEEQVEDLLYSDDDQEEFDGFQ